MQQIRNEIIYKIVSSIPGNMKPVEYIMQVLHISKGSAYRRLKGTLPFTYDEIAVLAREMNFSVDEVIHSQSRRKYIFDFGDYFNEDTSTAILNSLGEYYNLLLSEQEMKMRYMIITINNLWFVYTFHFDNLFRFFYYKFLQQSDISHLKNKMKEIDIPQTIFEIKSKLADLMRKMDNTYRTSILDRHVFLNTIYEIQYYYRRKLIDDNELDNIAKDMEHLLNAVEKEIIENRYNSDKNQYFLAERNIYTNSVSIKTDTQLYAHIYQNNLYPIMCYDQQLCQLHRKYLESHKKQSRLISSSSEELQIDFFEKQYGYVQNLRENKSLMI
ncbi:MAG TPA: hypothetical protein DIT04_10710 [Dysgonomonas sp.]|nr:hypothetical protein [Dysgonomonas sp.]